MADVKMHCLQAILCLVVISCRAENPRVADPNESNASPNPRVNIDMSRVLGSLVSKFYSNLPSLNTADAEESQVQEEVPSNSFLQEIKAGRHGSGPFHVYGRHIGHGPSRGSSHKLSGAGSGNKDHYNIVDVL